MDKVQILADIIEPALSGQYGRDTAEEIAGECVRTLGMKNPIKWEVGIYIPDKNYINWGWGGFVYAETEQQAVELCPYATERAQSFGPGHTVHARLYLEKGLDKD